MSKNGWLALGMVLGAVLAAALVFALRGGEPTLEGPAPAAAAQADMARPAPFVEPVPPAEAQRAAEPAPDGPGEPAAPATHAPVDPVEPGHPDEPPPPMAESPFATENSREIDYAFELVFGPDAGVESAKVAAEVFQKCLEAFPDNHRCYQGVVAAQQRQQPGWTPPAPPTPIAPLDLRASPAPSPLRPVPLGEKRPLVGPGPRSLEPRHK